jgi:hypothetical protein
MQSSLALKQVNQISKGLGRHTLISVYVAIAKQRRLTVKLNGFR